jgi:class 3 adenylate cyclase/pimeloyl-ACP methyl ester carboxylesterase
VRIPETRFARADDVDIAYQVFGSGPIDLVWVPGWISHIEVMWELAEFARFLERLSTFSRVVTFDKRGTGLSDQIPGVATLDERIDDVSAVLDAASVERAVLVGWFDAAAILALFASRYPNRVRGLIAGSAAVKLSPAAGEPWGMNPSVVERAAHAIENGDWGHATMLELIAPSVTSDERIVAWWRRYERMSATPNAAAAMLRANQQIDVREILGAIHAPTLVLNRRGTRLVDSAAVRYFADQISGAQFHELPGEDVFPYLGDQDSVLAEIEEFVTGTRPPPPTDRFLATIVFTDVVASTELAQQHGDTRWRDTLDAHNALARRIASRYGGRIVDTAGDGALAAFDGPTHGIEYARAFADAAHELGLQIRAGVHTGEVEHRGNDLAGIGVHVGARVAALAGPDQILVTNTVRELAFGSPAIFIDHGEHELRGVSGTWHLYAVEMTPA